MWRGHLRWEMAKQDLQLWLHGLVRCIHMLHLLLRPHLVGQQLLHLVASSTKADAASGCIGEFPILGGASWHSREEMGWEGKVGRAIA